MIIGPLLSTKRPLRKDKQATLFGLGTEKEQDQGDHRLSSDTCL